MKKLRPALVFSFLGIATFASLVGTVSGTLAWYAYTSRVTLSYSGTSIENTVQLQVGLVTENPMPVIPGDDDNKAFWDMMEQAEDFSEPGSYYYFAPLGAGLSSSVINAYLGANGYATTELRPSTSGYYDPTDQLCDFALKKSPTSTHHQQDIAALTEDYIVLPLVFRASKSKTATNDFVGGQEIWLTDAKAVASSTHDGEVFKAMRVYFDRVSHNSQYETNYIVNPNVNGNVAGETKVGGLLDLTDDKYYDFDDDGEVMYGEWESPADPTTVRNNTRYSVPDGETNPVLDLNRDKDARLGIDDANTYCARHHVGSKYYESLDGIIFKTAKYETLGSIKPIRNNTNGKLSNADPDHPTSVCFTANSETNELRIGRVDATIWLEGWDYSVIDEEIAHAFDFGLTFEINKAGAQSIMNKKKMVAYAGIGTMAIMALSVSITLAWYGASDRLKVENLDLTVNVRGDLKISTSPDENTFVTDLYNEDLNDLGDDFLFAPVSSMNRSQWMDQKSDTPLFYDSAYKQIFESTGEPYVEQVEKGCGFFQKDIYLLTNIRSQYAVLDFDHENKDNGSYFESNDNSRRAQELYDAYHEEWGLTKEQIQERLDNLINSLRVSILVNQENFYHYYIIDPIKQAGDKTYLGGRLDNNNNGYFDTYKDRSTSEPTLKEVVYGEISDRSQIVYDDPSGQDIEPVIKSQHFVNSFEGVSRKDAYRYNHEATIEKGLIAEEGALSISELDVEDPELKIPLKAGEPTKITLSIYLEGWDLDCINATMGASFKTKLSFKLKGGNTL